jgi:hypothetical protein
LERARRDFGAGQYDNARIEYLNVLQLDPRNRIAIQGKFADAGQAYAEAVKIKNQLVPAFTRLQKLYAGPLDNTEKAAEFASKVKALSPEGAQAASTTGAGKL